MERQKFTKTEKQYQRGIIHNLSLQRWTDQEITDYLYNEKNMNISRSQVSRIKNIIEESAEKWYIELRQSRYKLIATYKERLDSLLSYQKTLNDIVTTTKKEENKIRAIATLQSIELDIFNIYKQLPNIRIEDVNNNDNDNQENKDDPLPDPTMEQVWGSEPSPTSIDNDNDNAIPIVIETTTQVTTTTTSSSPNTSSTSKEEKEKKDDYVWKL